VVIKNCSLSLRDGDGNWWASDGAKQIWRALPLSRRSNKTIKREPRPAFRKFDRTEETRKLCESILTNSLADSNSFRLKKFPPYRYLLALQTSGYYIKNKKMMIIIPWTFNPDTAIDYRTRSTGSHGLIVKGKRISCPPHSSRQSGRWCRTRDDYEHGFPLIRSLRASAQRSTSVLFSFVLSLLIVAGSFAIWQSKTILSRSNSAARPISGASNAAQIFLRSFSTVS